MIDKMISQFKQVHLTLTPILTLTLTLSLTVTLTLTQTLFLVQNPDGSWPIEMEEREGLSNCKNRPAEDKDWLFIVKVEKQAEVCGFQVGDVIMEIGSENKIPRSLMQFSIITKDHGFFMVEVYRPSLDAAV